MITGLGLEADRITQLAWVGVWSFELPSGFLAESLATFLATFGGLC